MHVRRRTLQTIHERGRSFAFTTPLLVRDGYLHLEQNFLAVVGEPLREAVGFTVAHTVRVMQDGKKLGLNRKNKVI